ncbi:outer membrane beta-barrel protein [Flavisolibacter tropicus]|uniref:TonB-dependent receptor n=1 Tax=Flavisolibacter tropicus TaxID=1492898 RepID=A0A172TVU0_9BACT|nr:outer membrane beta-barrel protein [Flavisolibacter tropicus]ANE51150.1 TonB-dependent receptor [Flavisolibacter tropicus]
MRKHLLVLLSLFSSTLLLAQHVSGLIHDDSGKPVSGATVSLLHIKDSSTFKFATTKDDGRFSIMADTGSYLVNVSYIGFTPYYTSSITVSNKDITLPIITLKKADASTLKGVTVTSTRPMIEVKADKTVLNVEGTINAVGNDALELLRKSPGVMVDKDDNISLSGKNGVQIYIDGRPSPLTGQDLASYLKTLQSSQIEAIEIITNPSSKYDAAGNAGIINIRLKKNKSFGTNGSVNAGWNIGTYAKYNGGLSLNHRNAKINTFGNFNYFRARYANYMNMYRETVTDSLFQQHNDMQFKNNSIGFKAGLDYFLSKKSTVGFITNGNLADQNFSTNGNALISHLATKDIDRIMIANNNNEIDRDNVNINLNYRYNDTSGRELNVDADYGWYHIVNNQLQPTDMYAYATNTLLSRELQNMYTPSRIDIYTIKADYDQNLWKGRVGLGGKLSFVKSDNAFDQYDMLHPSGPFTEGQNNFDYRENINAGYATYNRQIKKVTFQVGLRVENTNAEGHSAGKRWYYNADGTGSYKYFDSLTKRNYTDVFPSASITLNQNPDNQFSISYSRRIDRPAYQDLNPFEFRLDKYAFRRGNTLLQPQYTNIIDITHAFKSKLTTKLTYSHVNDVFAQVIDVVETNQSQSYLTKKNLATQDIVGLNFSYNLKYKALTSYINLNTYYSHFKSNDGPTRNIDINVYAANVYAQNSVKLSEIWSAELSGWYSTPSLWQGTFKSWAMGGLDIGGQAKLLKGKATIKATVTDFLHTLKWGSTNSYAGQYSRMNGGWESRQFRLNLTYRFGSTEIKAARQRNTASEEENKRTQGGGGSPNQ